MNKSRIKSAKILKAARGEQCTLQIVGACSGDTSTTVAAHLPDESHGMGRKSDDISICFACHNCHSVIDGRTAWPINGQESEGKLGEWYFRRAMTRTWRRLIETGVIKV